MPASSNMPWIVPSSPCGPCSTGKTTSTPASTWPASVTALVPGPACAARAIDSSGPNSAAPAAPLPARSKPSGSPLASQRPSRVIPIGTTS